MRNVDIICESVGCEDDDIKKRDLINEIRNLLNQLEQDIEKNETKI